MVVLICLGLVVLVSRDPFPALFDPCSVSEYSLPLEIVFLKDGPV